MLSAKDLITENNVIETKTRGKYIVFTLTNGVHVMINPNEVDLSKTKEKK